MGNGSVGKLAEFNKDKGRWLVEFSSGSSNNFKEENLELMPDNDVADDNEEPPTAKVYITNLNADVIDKDLIDLFSRIGMIAKEPTRKNSGGTTGFQDQWPYAAKVYKPGRSNGDGCVEYVDKMAAKAAIKTYNGYKLKGSRIKVEYAGQGRQYSKTELTLPWAERPENQGRVGEASDEQDGTTTVHNAAVSALSWPHETICEC